MCMKIKMGQSSLMLVMLKKSKKSTKSSKLKKKDLDLIKELQNEKDTQTFQLIFIDLTIAYLNVLNHTYNDMLKTKKQK